ncbi:MAG: molybdopterin synthase sulfur carrier subunit [Acidobacteria bacterium]|nr:MAG: molybdopterin synthase sulfur carrier subunit [Acidobacteriota bacterium]
MKVFVPTPLRSYTGGAGEVEAQGGSLRDLLSDLDRRYPGIRFRMIDEQDGIRPHIKIFVNQEQARTIDRALGDRDEIQIICALSGGCAGPAGREPRSAHTWPYPA